MQRLWRLVIHCSFLGAVVATNQFRMQAFVDTRSMIVLRKNTAQWIHYDYAAPGRWHGDNFPTIINGIGWYPSWPNTNGRDNKNCGGCRSSIFQHLDPEIPEVSFEVILNKLDCRGECFVVEQPSTFNNFTTKVEFVDYHFGPSWKEISFEMPPPQTPSPTVEPSETPSATPTQAPTVKPSAVPTTTPSQTPTAAPTWAPSVTPSQTPTAAPSRAPSITPSQAPSAMPTQAPTVKPSVVPSATPSQNPKATSTRAPSVAPSQTPSATPTQAPTAAPSPTPSVAPSRPPQCVRGKELPSPPPPPFDAEFWSFVDWMRRIPSYCLCLLAGVMIGSLRYRRAVLDQWYYDTHCDMEETTPFFREYDRY